MGDVTPPRIKFDGPILLLDTLEEFFNLGMTILTNLK